MPPPFTAWDSEVARVHGAAQRHRLCENDDDDDDDDELLSYL